MMSPDGTKFLLCTITNAYWILVLLCLIFGLSDMHQRLLEWYFFFTQDALSDAQHTVVKVLRPGRRQWWGQVTDSGEARSPTVVRPGRQQCRGQVTDSAEARSPAVPRPCRWQWWGQVASSAEASLPAVPRPGRRQWWGQVAGSGEARLPAVPRPGRRQWWDQVVSSAETKTVLWIWCCCM